MPEVPGSSEGQREGQNQPRGLAPRRRPARGRSARLAETRVWGACGGEPAAPGDAGPCLETLGSVWGAEGGRPGPEGLRGSPGLCQQRPGRSPSTSPGLGRPSASQTYPRATRRSQAPPETAGSPPQTSQTRVSASPADRPHSGRLLGASCRGALPVSAPRRDRVLGPRVPAGSNLGPLDWSLNLGPMAAGLYFFSARYQREWPLGLQGWGLAGSKVAWPGVRGQEGQVLGAGGQAALLGTGGG